MPVIPNVTIRNSPGVYVSENTYGSIPATLSSHDSVYVLGVGSNSSAPVNTPTFVSNIDDFTNVFGASASTPAIKLFFDQRPGNGLYFVNVEKRVERTISITSVSVGTAYTVTVDGFLISYTAVTGDTTDSVTAALGAKINQLIPQTASYYTGIIRSKPGITITGGSGVTLGSVSSVGAYPTPRDVGDTLRIAFTPEYSQGFLAAPEFYQSFTSLSDRTLLQSLTEAFCADPDYYWVNLVDCGSTTATSTTGGGAINLALAERATFASPRGHSWFYFPYVVNENGVNVPSALAALGAGLRRARATGNIFQPFAGTSIPLYNVKGTSFNVTKLVQDQLNPKGINCIRVLPNRGTVAYGARTLSTSKYYVFGVTRLIFNILAGSLKAAFDVIVFNLIDGQGILFSVAKQTAARYCEQLRQAGALYGATPDAAYLVICDNTNNTADQLEAGALNIDVVAIPSPIAEAVNINLNRASIGTILTEVKTSGDTQAASNITTTK
jgi:phage tail sheath protein FI